MRVETCCGGLWVEVSGEGRDLVLWPSLLMDGGMWHHQVAAFSARHRVVSIDPPGHGRSEPTARAYGMDDCVRAARTVLDAVGARGPAWCGLSWGGMVGMRLAARYPRLLSSLILADTTARRAPRSQRARYGLLAAIARRVGPIPPLLRRVEPLMFGDPTAHPDEVRRFRAHVAGMDRRSIGHAVDAVLLNRDDVSEEVQRIALPTLVVVGEEDTALPPRDSVLLAAAIPDAELVRLRGAGHLSCMEAPGAFTAAVTRFLASHDAPAATLTATLQSSA